MAQMLVLTEDQEDIRRTARAFVQERAPVTHLRGLRDAHDPVGFSRDLWRELANLGLVGMAIPEAYGGGGLGFAELGLVLEELGRNLVPTPFLSTAVLGASAILLAGSEAQRQDILPAVCSGERVLAFAFDEGTRHAGCAGVRMTATRAPGGYTLRGEKSLVLDGHVADTLIVAANAEAGGLSLFLVPRDAPGVTVHRLDTIDSRNAARITFDGVVVAEPALLGAPGAASAAVQQVLDRGAIALAAEMFGSLTEAFERTVAYLKVRKQFGVAIGSFQALKHRAAHMFCEVELSRSIVLEALRALDDPARPASDVSQLASVAKARVSDTFVLVASEAIQMHGGIGVTDELDIGFFYKRAYVAAATLGASSYHRDRFARLRGY
jgi:alkylation response protein AidB-like acyl-CoA dehydrogenase